MVDSVATRDHVGDVANGGVELVRLSRLYEFPAFVKTSSQNNNCTVPAGLSKAAYADPVRTLYPCHTAASTWLSALYFAEKRAEFHPKDQKQIEERLQKSAAFFGIQGAVDAIQRRWQELHKTAEETLPDSAFAYVWVGDDGRKERLYRLKTAAEVKLAADYLRTHRDAFPYGVRQVMATKILNKAASFGTALGDNREFLEQQAGRGVCSPAAVSDMIRARVARCKTAELQERFNALADTVDKAPRITLHPDNLVKLATLIDQLDRSLNLLPEYGQGMKRPEEVIFAATFTKAAEERQQRVVTTTGKIYEKDALAKIPSSEFTDLFGADFARRICTPLGDVDPEKLAEEIATLPRPDAELLDGLLQDNGVAPILTRTEPVHSPNWAAIADAYC